MNNHSKNDTADNKVYVGAISGTSMDGMDIAIVRFVTHAPFVESIGTKTYQYPSELLCSLRILAADYNQPYHTLLTLDSLLGEYIAVCITDCMTHYGVLPEQVAAIGSHGQTVQHQPHAEQKYTCQIGNAAVIAERTQCAVISDFRMTDIAAGGEGAPFICAFHDWLAQCYRRCLALLNIGGICNITHAAPDGTTIGYDLGPGNCLLDAHIRRTLGRDYDAGGQWAHSGQVQPHLLSALLQDAYFNAPAPKSTGPEHFNLAWLDAHCQAQHQANYRPEDIQATLVELTATLVARALLSSDAEKLYVFGGGAHNQYLCTRMAAAVTQQVMTSESLQINPDSMEAIGFAWLARQTLTHETNNLPAVTGALGKRVCGAVRMP